MNNVKDEIDRSRQRESLGRIEYQYRRQDQRGSPFKNGYCPTEEVTMVVADHTGRFILIYYSQVKRPMTALGSELVEFDR